jgi:hypothetical protein
MTDAQQADPMRVSTRLSPEERPQELRDWNAAPGDTPPPSLSQMNGCQVQVEQ